MNSTQIIELSFTNMDDFFGELERDIKFDRVEDNILRPYLDVRFGGSIHFYSACAAYLSSNGVVPKLVTLQIEPRRVQKERVFWWKEDVVIVGAEKDAERIKAEIEIKAKALGLDVRQGVIKAPGRREL